MSSARNTDKNVNSYIAQFEEDDTVALIETLQNEAQSISEFVFAPENSDRIFTEKGRFGATLMEDYSISMDAAAMAQYLLLDYPEKMIETVNASRETLSRLNENEYAAKEQQKIISQYNRVRRFKLRSNEAAGTWLSMQSNYIYFGILLLLALIVISAECFTCEYSHGMNGMVFATPNGRLRLFLVKLLAMVIVAVTTVLLYAVAELFVSIYNMGAQTLGEPLQVISDFQGCPFSITIGGYIAAKHILLLLLLFAALGVSAFVCAFIKRGFPSMMISALPFAAGVFVWVYMLRRLNNVFVSQHLSTLRIWLPICFIDIKYYFEKFDCFDFFGIPTERFIVCAAVCVLIFVLTTMLAAVRYGKTARLKG